MRKNRQASAMMIIVFSCILVSLTLLLIMSKNVESSVRYSKINNQAITNIIEDRNRNEKLYTEIYYQLKKDEEINLDSFQEFDYLGVKYKEGPIFLADNKYKYIFTDDKKDYEFIIYESIDNDIKLYRQY